jgi:uridine kinase
MPQEVTREALTRTVAELAARIQDRPVWIGIDGLGAAGKSTLAAAIAAAVPRAVVVNTDDFQGDGVEEWDWDRFRHQVFEPLCAGREGRYQVRQWGESTDRGWRTVACDAVVLVEGVSATRMELSVPWDLTVWVDAPGPVRRARALQRDGMQAADVWERQWWPSEERYLAREHPAERVDLVISGADAVP